MVNPFWAAQAARDCRGHWRKSASMRENACSRKRLAAWQMPLDKAGGQIPLGEAVQGLRRPAGDPAPGQRRGRAFAGHNGGRNRGNSSDSRFLTGGAAQQGREKYAGGVAKRWLSLPGWRQSWCHCCAKAIVGTPACGAARADCNARCSCSLNSCWTSVGSRGDAECPCCGMARPCPRISGNPVSHVLRRLVIRKCPSRVDGDNPESVHIRTPLTRAGTN